MERERVIEREGERKSDVRERKGEAAFMLLALMKSTTVELWVYLSMLRAHVCVNVCGMIMCTETEVSADTWL